MITTETPPIPTRLHVSRLADETINALVHEHIFKQSRICSGLTSPGMRPGQLCCTECGTLIDETMSMQLFGESSHPRTISQYTKNIGIAWSIVDVIRRQTEAVQSCFVLFLDLQIRDEFEVQRQDFKVRYSLQRFFFGISPRRVAIAALQAMDVIDTEGFVREGEAEP